MSDRYSDEDFFEDREFCERITLGPSVESPVSHTETYWRVVVQFEEVRKKYKEDGSISQEGNDSSTERSFVISTKNRQTAEEMRDSAHDLSRYFAEMIAEDDQFGE